MNSKILISLLVFSFYQKLHIVDTQEKHGFRTTAPQIICTNHENSTTSNVSENIVINFQPRDGIKFSYKFRIFFKSLDNTSFSQRETLLIWKAVRTLEHRLNVVDRLAITKENMVFVNKSEIFSGVNYIFHVTGVTDAGETSEEEIFSVKYSSGDEKAKEVNLLLIGSEVAITSLSLTYHAKVTFCNRPFNYYVRWRVYNVNSELKEFRNLIGSSMEIAPNTLIPDSEATIEAQVFDEASSNLIAKEIIKVNVVTRGFQAYIIPTSAKIGINCTLTLRLFIEAFDDNSRDIEVFWEYYDARFEAATFSAKPHRQSFLIIAFDKPSRYVVLATAICNGISTKVTASIEVVSNSFVGFDFNIIPIIYPVAKKSYDFTVMVVGLMPKCRAAWTCIQEDGFKFIDPKVFGRDNLGAADVSNRKEIFLNEISDVIYEKVHKEITLSIPSEDDKWKGLEGNVQYKFRLNIVCPVINPYIQSGISNILSFFEFIVHTNAPPAIERMEINPNTGLALKTIFQISCVEAKDLLLDAPISYELCGYFDGYLICYGKFFEYKLWETVLPFTKSPSKMFIRVCDIRHACNTIYRTIDLVNFTLFTDPDFNDMKSQILSAFRRTDYVAGNNLILAAAITFKNISPKLLEKLRVFVENLLERETNRLIEETVEYIPSTEIIKIVSQLKTSLELLSLNNTRNIEKLLELLDHSMPISNEKLVSTDLENGNNHNAEAIKENFYIDATFIRLNLLLIGNIVQSKSTLTQADVANILDRFNMLVKQMCGNTKVGYQLIETQYSTIEMEKCSGAYLMRKEFKITPQFTMKDGLFKLIPQNNKIDVNKNYCVIAIQHSTDYYSSEDTLLIGIKVFDISNESNVLEFGFDVGKGELESQVLYVDVPKTHHEDDVCLFLKEKKWSQHACMVRRHEISHISCTCPDLGYIRLGKSGARAVTQTTLDRISTLHSGTEGHINFGSPQPPTTPGYWNETKQSLTTKKAGMNLLYLMIPLTAALIGLSAIFFVVYYRRSIKHDEKKNDNKTPILKMRKRRLGIKYATLSDINLLRGTD